MRYRFFWPLCVGLITLTSLTGAVALVVAAHGDSSFAVEPRYYERAVRWDEDARRRRLFEELGYRVAIEEAGEGRIVVRVESAGGRDLPDALVRATVFPSVRASLRQDLRLAPIGKGRYEAPFRLTHEGQWRWAWEIEHDGAIASGQSDQTLPLPPADGGAP